MSAIDSDMDVGGNDSRVSEKPNLDEDKIQMVQNNNNADTISGGLGEISDLVGAEVQKSLIEPNIDVGNNSRASEKPKSKGLEEISHLAAQVGGEGGTTLIDDDKGLEVPVGGEIEEEGSKDDHGELLEAHVDDGGVLSGGGGTKGLHIAEEVMIYGGGTYSMEGTESEIVETVVEYGFGSDLQTKEVSVCVPPDDQNCEEYGNMEVEGEMKTPEGFFKQEDIVNQSDESDFQTTFDESNAGISLDVDLDSAFGTGGMKAVANDGSDANVANVRVGKRMKKMAKVEQPEESEFAVSDLVWGKVKSHPWWPGQIFDPWYASDKAMKHYRKDCFLVAYFGDKSFAWNERASLKPFKDNFSEMVKQTNAAVFHDAVTCALDDVSRRVELGLSCSCTPEELYVEMKSQMVMNAGIKENKCQTDGVDRFFSVTSFEPGKLAKYIKVLALDQCNVGDRLELAIAQAQLLAFYSWKGYFQLPEFSLLEGLSVHADHTTPVHADHTTPVHGDEEKAHIGKRKPRTANVKFAKRHGNLEDDLKFRKKERSLTELMDRKNRSVDFTNGVDADSDIDEKSAPKSKPSSSTKRKIIDSSPNNRLAKSRRQRLAPSKNVETESPTSRASKVGERFCNIAKQLTGSPPVLKNSGDKFQKNSGDKFQRSDVKVDSGSKKFREVDVITNASGRSSGRPVSKRKDYSSPDVMLSQLCLAARDPMKGYSFLTTIVGYFTGFRSSVSLNSSFSVKGKKSAKKMRGGEGSPRNGKLSNSKVSSPEAYGCEAFSDSYWTDRIIQNSPDEKLSSRRRKRKAEGVSETPLNDDPTFELKISHDMNNPISNTIEPLNPFQWNPTEHSEQQCPEDRSNLVTEGSVGDKNDAGEISPTALILKFTDANSIPLESDLNRIFSSFGSIKESETEILRKTNQAKVVFQRRSDAEEAFRCACKFRVFGAALVSYELNYSPSTPSKGSPCIKRQSTEHPASLEGNTN